jgi:pyruvate formate lyase activating enzyme
LAFSGWVLELFRSSARAQNSNLGKGLILKREAMFYEKLEDGRIQCYLCPRRCLLTDGMRGFCRAREPENGIHYSLVYGNPTAVHVDPIEKKPLFHFLPATTAFSIATAGCNFRCRYCQNWQISQFPPEETLNYQLSPQETVEGAIKFNCPTIAYTYTEPSIFYEYMFDTAKLARARGIKNIYHSNGSLNPEPVRELCRYLDGANIDLKGFTQDFYWDVCGGYLETVLGTIKTLKENNVHVEITNLVVPTLNDNPSDIRKMCQWIRDEAGKDIPIHFSRFHPTYKLRNLPPTPVKTLEEARRIALEEGLEFVYIGNVPGHEAESTYCPRDGKILIRRVGYSVLENNIIDGKCKFCGRDIPGVWQEDTNPSQAKAIHPSKYLG